MAQLRTPSVREHLRRWALSVQRAFPDRHVYVRTRAGVRGLVLTTGRQVSLLAGLVALVSWATAASIGFLAASASSHDAGRAAVAERLALERAGAARDARLIAAAETLARERTQRLRMVLGAAGVTTAPAGPARADATLLESGPPSALAAVLGVDEPLAARVQRAAREVAQARALARVADAAPLSRPTSRAAWSDDFGVRRDPFTGRAAFHPGVDIAAPMMTPIYATARGVVSFAGVRPGYGSTVEIDHGTGLTTRFAHLAAIFVRPGETVDTHTELGATGSTGRSTGPHLHYEIRRNGRPEDPGRFLRAGDDVQQAG